jgi:WD domain, G-beta repeat
VLLWDVATDQPIRELRHESTPTAIAFSPEGKHLAVAAQDGSVRMWDYVTGRPGMILEAVLPRTEGATSPQAFAAWHPGIQFTLAYSPDGRTLAAAGKDSLIHLWETATLKKRATLAGHTGAVYAVSFAADGKTLASAGQDGVVRLWDMTSKLPGGSAKDKLPARVLEHAWQELRHADAGRAFQVIRFLTAAPEASLSFLGMRLTPVTSVSPRVVELIADLDRPQHATRHRAMLELEKIGEAAQPGLQQALGKKPSLELKRRVEQLLQRLEALPLNPERLGNIRALEVLENLATLEARQVLDTIARGLPEARLTLQAQTVLLRLGRRPGPSS